MITADDSVTVVTAVNAAVPNTAGDLGTGFANTGTQITVNKPVNTANSDLLVAAVYGRNSSAPYTTPPAGWTIVPPSVDNPRRCGSFLHPPGHRRRERACNWTWAGGGSGRHVGEIIRVTGAHATPLDSTGAVATAISGPYRIIEPQLTNIQDGVLLIAVATSNGTGGVGTAYSSSQLTVTGSVKTNTGASESGMTMGFQAGQPAGATNTRVMTAVDETGYSTGHGYMIRIRSAG